MPVPLLKDYSVLIRIDVGQQHMPERKAFCRVTKRNAIGLWPKYTSHRTEHKNKPITLIFFVSRGLHHAMIQSQCTMYNSLFKFKTSIQLLVIFMALAVIAVIKAPIHTTTDFKDAVLPVDSLDAKIVNSLSTQSIFDHVVLVTSKNASPDKTLDQLTEALASLGYTNLSDPSKFNVVVKESLALLGYFDYMKQGEDKNFTQSRAEQIKSSLANPFMDSGLIAIDRTGFMMSALGRFSQLIPHQSATTTNQATQQSSPSAFIQTSLDPIDLQSLDNVRLKFADSFHFFGPDFFTIDNKNAVERDIYVASLIGFVCNAVIFFLFIRNIKFIGLFLLTSIATAIATAGGLYLFYQQVFTLVFAVASSFLSFNTEYLIHFLGEDFKNRTFRSAMGAAIGTSAIALAMIWFSKTLLLQQIAFGGLISIFGFVAASIPFQKAFASIQISISPSPATPNANPSKKIPIPASTAIKIIAIPLILAASLLIFGLNYGANYIETDIRHFNFKSTLLADSEATFAPYLKSHGQEWQSNTLQDFSPDDQVKILDDQSSFEKFIDALPEHFSNLNRLTQSVDFELKKNQIEFSTSPSAPSSSLKPIHQDLVKRIYFATNPTRVIPLDNHQQLILTNHLSPYKPTIPGTKVNALSAFNTGLSKMTKELIGLAGFSLFVMLIYLRLVTKDTSISLLALFPTLCVMPLLLSAALFFHIKISFVHGLAFMLILGFALDYPAILLSKQFEPTTIKKVLITAASTIGSFAGLACASHPLIRVLGQTVILGTFLSLCLSFSLIKLQYPPQKTS
jgi:hypothetical protein